LYIIWKYRARTSLVNLLDNGEQKVVFSDHAKGSILPSDFREATIWVPLGHDVWLQAGDLAACISLPKL
jgi:hypothetical protein